MNVYLCLALILATIVYIFRRWSFRGRFLIPLIIIVGIIGMMEPKRREDVELYNQGIPVKALVEKARCYSATMDVRYSFEVNGKRFGGEYRDWDCGEVAVGQHFDLVYLSRAPEIHTWNRSKPVSRFSQLLLALVLYLFILAMNAAVVQSKSARK